MLTNCESKEKRLTAVRCICYGAAEGQNCSAAEPLECLRSSRQLKRKNGCKQEARGQINAHKCFLLCADIPFMTICTTCKHQRIQMQTQNTPGRNQLVKHELWMRQTINTLLTKHVNSVFMTEVLMQAAVD